MASIMNKTLYPSHIALTSKNASDWQKEDPVLLKGELGIETDTSKVKAGNGNDNWNNLSYLDADIQTALTEIYTRIGYLETLAEAILTVTDSVIKNIQRGEA